MENSREEVKDAVLLFAEKYNKKEGFAYLLQGNGTLGGITNLPEIVNLIIREMFRQVFDFNTCSNTEYNAYKIIHDYYTEMYEVGYVRHDK